MNKRLSTMIIMADFGYPVTGFLKFISFQSNYKKIYNDRKNSWNSVIEFLAYFLGSCSVRNFRGLNEEIETKLPEIWTSSNERNMLDEYGMAFISYSVKFISRNGYIQYVKMVRNGMLQEIYENLEPRDYMNIKCYEKFGYNNEMDIGKYI